MPAFLLLALAIVARLFPHHGLWNFSFVGGSLLYFGARRPLSQMWLPMAALIGLDYYMTTAVYSYTFVASGYLLTWTWYAGMILLGKGMLANSATARRVLAAGLLGPTGFFLLSNFSVWLGGLDAKAPMYPMTPGGLVSCYVAGVPFYQNDLLSTLVVLGAAFGLPVLVRMARNEMDASKSTL